MKKHDKKVAKSLVLCLVMASVTGYAQTPSTNEIQEAFNFINSPQGTGVVNKVRILTRACLGQVGFSNELARVSTNTTFALPIRQLAQETLQTYDKSATNSYLEIETFVSTWPFSPNEDPPMTTNAILVYKRLLEIGSSAFVHFYNIQNDTNFPSLYRETIGNTISNILLETFD